MEDKMNTAVIGCGMISDTYLQSLKQFSILQIDSCCDLNEDRAAAMAGKFGIRARTLDDILEDKNIELIINLTNPSAHYGITRRALEAEKHVCRLSELMSKEPG